MSQFTFRIRPLTLETGVELICDGIIPDPLEFGKLHDAVIHSLHVGKDLDAQIQIFDCDGKIAERIEINPPGFVAWHLRQQEAA